MRPKIFLMLAMALCAVHTPGTPMAFDAAAPAPDVRQSAKKPAKKIRTAVRKRDARLTDPKMDATAIAASVEQYKKTVAQRISDADPAGIHDAQPQALLRSVVVIRFSVDKNGKLIDSAIQRSNGDPVTEAAALASLRKAAPLPKPPAGLLVRGRIELLETWLFNSDGRFQTRSIAQAQKSE